MNPLKKITVAALAALCSFAACTSDPAPNNDPLAGVNLPTCPTVQNPLTDYWWLAREIGYIESSNNSSAKSKIYSGQYKGKTLYFFEHFYPNNPNFLVNASVSACNGTGLIGYCQIETVNSTGGTPSLTQTPCKEDK
jgi:hypothetical protein